MSDKTDYEALKKSVKYIPWKGKKTEWYTWHKTFLVQAMIRRYHGILVGLEAVPNNETAKKLAALTAMMSNKKTIQQLQDEYKSLCKSVTVLHSRHHNFRNRGHHKRQGPGKRQYSSGMEKTI